MTTFASIKSSVRSVIQLEGSTALTSTDGLVNLCVNEALCERQRNHELTFNVTVSGALTVSTSTGIIALPSDFLSMTANRSNPVLWTDGTNVYPLVKSNDAEFDAYKYRTGGASQTGLPRVYNFRNGQITLFPIPTTTSTVTLTYIKKYDNLVNDGDTNDWTNNADVVLINDAVARVLVIRELPQLGAVYKGKADALVASLNNQYQMIDATTGIYSETII